MLTFYKGHPHKGLAFFLFAFALGLSSLVPQRANAQEPISTSSRCYAVADLYIDNQGDVQQEDTLIFLNQTTGENYPLNQMLGNTGTDDIEAIALQPGGLKLFAVDGNQLGTLDLDIGTFIPMSTTIGTGQGQLSQTPELESVTFKDVDSLSFDPITGELWAVERREGLDLLFKLDPSTGQFMPDVFPDPNNSGAFVDFVQVQPIDDLRDVDDIAVDPINGVMYASINQAGQFSKLGIIDTSNGSTTEVGTVIRRSNGNTVQDIEGLGFANDGQLYGSIGSGLDAQPNTLWRIDKTTAIADPVAEFEASLRDIEGLDCLSSSGFIVIDKYINGLEADTVANAPVFQVGDVVTSTYIVRNTGALPLSNVTVTDDNGTVDTADDLNICSGFDLGSGKSNEDVGVLCQTTTTAQQGVHSSVGRVIATDASGNEYSSEDGTHYLAYNGAAVGDLVWLDNNGNGIQDPFELNDNVSNVMIELYSGAGEFVNEMQSSNGSYLFNDLLPGDYYLEFGLPAGYEFTISKQGNNDEKDSDANPIPDAAIGRTRTFTLTDGVVNRNMDVGFTGGQSASLEGLVWEDVNGDGVNNDGAESLLDVANLTVILYRFEESNLLTPTITMTATTAVDGSYSLAPLEAGDYSLEFSLSGKYDAFTLQNQGDSEDLDSDANPNTGRTALITLQNGEQKTDQDAGVMRAVAIGGKVWHDVDEDGTQDGENVGVAGVTLTLYNKANTVISTTTTLNDGDYLFTRTANERPLLPGEYKIEVSALPTYFALTQADVGDDETDSDADRDTGMIELFSILSGARHENYDVGVYLDISPLYLPLLGK